MVIKNESPPGAPEGNNKILKFSEEIRSIYEELSEDGRHEFIKKLGEVFNEFRPDTPYREVSQISEEGEILEEEFSFEELIESKNIQTPENFEDFSEVAKDIYIMLHALRYDISCIIKKMDKNSPMYEGVFQYVLENRLNEIIKTIRPSSHEDIDKSHFKYDFWGGNMTTGLFDEICLTYAYCNIGSGYNDLGKKTCIKERIDLDIVSEMYKYIELYIQKHEKKNFIVPKLFLDMYDPAKHMLVDEYGRTWGSNLREMRGVWRGTKISVLPRSTVYDFFKVGTYDLEGNILSKVAVCIKH